MERIIVNQNKDITKIFHLKSNEHIVLNEVYTFPEKFITATILIKVVVEERASFDYTGLIDIPKGSEGINTKLNVKCLLLDKTSKARIIPSLEIKEDNVKAGHGASIGHIDQSQLEYISSRGIPKQKAKDLIIRAFLRF